MSRHPLLLGVAAIGAIGAADAPRPVDRGQAPQVYLPNAAARGTRVVRVGETFAVLPIVYVRAARIDQAIEVGAGGHRRQIDAGSVLPAVFLLAREGSSEGFIAYCTPRKAVERRLDGGFMGAMFGGALTRKVVRSVTDEQFCLADRDGDGAAEASMVVGDGWGSMRSPRTIAPVPLNIADDVPVSAMDDAVRITFTGGGKSGPEFRFAVVQQGKNRSFTTFGGQPSAVFVSGKAGWPQRTTIAAAQFDITGYDPAARAVTIRWPEDVKLDQRVAVSDGLTYTVRFGY